MIKCRQVVWNLPYELYQEIEKAKAAGQKTLTVPLDCSTENFALFLLNRAVKIYMEANTPKSPIIDPSTGDQYVGTRTKS